MKLKSQIESLLFISAKPMSASKLASLIKGKEQDVKKAGNELVEDYREKKSGIQIIKNGSKFQMVSSPENSKLIQEFVSDETTGELSRPSLETLTIIAYRGPISKINLDRIRGVNCSLILRNLSLRGLVEVKENKETGDTFYTVTFDFIRYLGINDVAELPEYERLHKDDTIDKVLEESFEEGEGIENSVVEKKEENEKSKEEGQEDEKKNEEPKKEDQEEERENEETKEEKENIDIDTEKNKEEEK